MSTETTRVETSTKSPTHEVKKTEEVKVEVKKPAPLLGSTEARERLYEAEAVIRRNTLWALGAGALVIPGVDVLAASAVQLKMLKNLADLYDVKFSEGVAKKLVGALLTSVSGVGVGMAASSAIKLIPVVGSVLGLLTMPLVTAAFTNALGRVFLMHFESGGTLLDFDPKAMQTHFKSEFERSRHVVEQLKKSEHKTEATQRTEHSVS